MSGSEVFFYQIPIHATLSADSIRLDTKTLRDALANTLPGVGRHFLACQSQTPTDEIVQFSHGNIRRIDCIGMLFDHLRWGHALKFFLKARDDFAKVD